MQEATFLWTVCSSQCEEHTVKTKVASCINNMSEPCEEERLCRKLLATFLHRVKNMRARWFPIVCTESGGLYTLLGLPFHDLYLPLMIKSGLIHLTSNQWGSNTPAPSFSSRRRYTWDDFLIEYHLNDEIEIAFLRYIL
jgi:hypothetical protein